MLSKLPNSRKQINYAVQGFLIFFFFTLIVPYKFTSENYLTHLQYFVTEE